MHCVTIYANCHQSRDYAVKVFGFATFGRVYGTIICVSGVVNFSQIGLDSLTHGPFRGNPIPVNVIMTVSGLVVGVALVAFTRVESKRLMREQRKEDAEYERERLIAEEPGA
jgi:multisubunit Na+/H+ antiporter MnhC subunit